MESWLIISLIAPFLWSLVVLIDVYFTQRVYTQAAEGTVISGLFQGLVLFSIPFLGVAWPEMDSAPWFVMGGIVFILAYHSYFQTMIRCGDGALVQILWNSSVLVVPIFAYLLAGERLESVHIIGIACAFLGGLLLSWDPKLKIHDLPAVFRSIVPGIVFLSLSMVFEKRAYELYPSFLPGFLLFSLGVVLGAIGVLVATPRAKKMAGRIILLCRQHWKFFVLAETLNVLGTVASQAAINLSPAVSFVAAIESLVPVFVMLNGIIIAGIFLFVKRESFVRMYREQSSGFLGKSGAILVIFLGIYLVAR